MRAHHLYMLLTHPRARDVDLTGLKMVIGGSALTEGLAHTALARGMDVFVGYGIGNLPDHELVPPDPRALTQDAAAQIPLRIQNRPGHPAGGPAHCR